MKKYQVLLPAGELETPVCQYFAKQGIVLNAQNRQYTCYAPELEVEFVWVRASSIPEILSNPLFPNLIGGLTGSDIIEESGVDSLVTTIPNPSCLYIGLAEKTKSISSLKNSIIATKYPNIAKKVFRQKNIPCSIYFIAGKDEVMPKISSQIKGILGLKSSGTTLQINQITEAETVRFCTINWLESTTKNLQTTKQKFLLKKVLNLA